MADISGRVVFDKNRSNSIDVGDSGLANVPVVLQNTATGIRLVVLTDVSGNYSFINVTNGNYRIVEAYGTGGGVPTPGDFNAAVIGSVPVGEDPPISFASSPPVGSTNLDSITPDTLLVTISGGNLINQNFLDGPVIYTPITYILDPCATVAPPNSITAANNGTFGSFPAGTVANTGEPTNPPYPGVTPGFIYVLPNPIQNRPNDGEYTVQNIMNNSRPNQDNVWWRIADHSTGNETGRFMAVNGANPGAVFFQQTVTVTPNTEYLFSSWILNLVKLNGLAQPALGVQIVDQNNNVIYNQTLGNLIPANINVPEWKQIGTVINSQNNTQLTVKFTSQGPAATGNDYTIDDILLQKINVPNFIPVKSIDKPYAAVGEIVTYTVKLKNTCNKPLTSVFFKDIIPSGLSFVDGSVIVNGGPNLIANPNAGFSVPNIPGGGTDTIIFKAQVNNTAVAGTTINNMATMSYYYTPVDGGIPNSYIQNSNIVPLKVIERDYGDAPDTSAGSAPNNYSTLLANNGPRHVVIDGFCLGGLITGEADAYQNPTATGDDLIKGIQDDALSIPIPELLVGQSTYSLKVQYTNNIGKDANIYGWIDFNRNGIFELNEKADLVTVPSSTTENPRYVTLNFTVPSGVSLVDGEYTFIRLRITTENLINTNNNLTSLDTRSIGAAENGEVEDYQIFIKVLSIEGTVWYDANCNGINDSGELLAEGVVVELYSFDNLTTAIAFTTTDVNGFYEFNNLDENNYYVKVIKPNGYNYTLTNIGTNDLVDSDINKNNGFSDLLFLNRDNSIIVVDAGLCRCNKVSGQSFYDCNGDDLLDHKDSYLCGVTVILLDSNLTVLDSTITDCDGYYEFNNLCAGNYTIQTVAPPDMSLIAQNLSQYYGSKPSAITSDFQVTLTNADYLQGFIGFKGNATLDKKYCVKVPTCNSSLTDDCSNYSYPNTCKNCNGTCKGCTNNCNGKCLGCNTCRPSNKENGQSCSSCNNQNCGCCNK